MPSSYVQQVYLSCTQPFLNSLPLYYLLHPYELLSSLFFSLDSSLIYNRNNTGLKIDPWGTPECISFKSDLTLSNIVSLSLYILLRHIVYNLLSMIEAIYLLLL
jgi:hypothetical protein